MKPYFKVWRFRSFIAKKVDARTITFHNHPGFLGFYGRVPLTRNWMLSVGLTSAG